jgi:hypothetical protein
MLESQYSPTLYFVPGHFCIYKFTDKNIEVGTIKPVQRGQAATKTNLNIEYRVRTARGYIPLQELRQNE